MNIKFKRIISFILVITMLLTMPGCATIDGRPASFFEVVIWIVGGILQMTALTVGELVLFVIFAVIDTVMRGIESVTGGDWWVVEDVGGPIMRGYGRLIDPNGRFADWSEPEDKEEIAIRDTNKFYAKDNIKEEKLLETSKTYGIPQGEESNIWTDLLDCDHTPYKYHESKCVIRCKCGANDFYWWDDKEYWDFDTFSECIRGIRKVFRSEKKQREYCVDHYMMYGGINRVIVELDNYLALPYVSKDEMEKWDDVIKMLNETNVWDKVYATFEDSADKMEDHLDYNETFSDSLDLLSNVIQMRQMILDQNDPIEASEHLIELTSNMMDTVGDYTGGNNVFLMSGLELLWPVVKAYNMGLTDAMADREIYALSVKYAVFNQRWEDLAERAQNSKTKEYIFWERYITFEHIMGTQYSYYIDGTNTKMNMPRSTAILYGDYTRLCLRSLPEALGAYATMGEDGQRYLKPYITFCMDEIFEELMGITYADYVKYLSHHS